MFKIFIGYEERETAAYHVLANSILRQASGPVSITPLKSDQIGVYMRTDKGSTDFAYTRFLVPYLNNFAKEYCLFMDCDMLVKGDIYDILEGIDPSKAVNVVKHDYKTKFAEKFLGNKNEDYPRKNWSSVMLFNTHKCDQLTPLNVNTKPPAWLHRFRWADDESIGELSKDWNHLVGEYDPNPNARIVHYTLGTPCFNEYSECEYSSEWFKEREMMLYADNR